MAIVFQELSLYKNFDELAADVLEMASEFMPDRQIYLTSLNDTHQTILKVIDNNSGSRVTEGLAIERFGTVCNRINFEKGLPLIFEDLRSETCLENLQGVFAEMNINSYIGVPIMLNNGDVFGTLCAVHPESAMFSDKNVKMFQRLARMFSYYLDLERLAFRDSLTGLYNRQFLYKYFTEYKAEGALFFLDLDGFKEINDTYGHDQGDLVLKEVATKLHELLIGLDGFPVRLGGDEFIIYFDGLNDLEETETKAEQALTFLSSWGSLIGELTLSVSIGIVRYLERDQSLKSILKNADSALYGAKQRGKNTFELFN